VESVSADGGTEKAGCAGIDRNRRPKSNPKKTDLTLWACLSNEARKHSRNCHSVTHAWQQEEGQI